MDAITAADAMKKILDEARKAYEPYRYDATSNDPQGHQQLAALQRPAAT